MSLNPEGGMPSYARCGLKHRVVVTTFLAVQTAVLSMCSGLFVFALDKRSLISEAHAATSKPACPGRDFRSFVAAFAESEPIQRQYTRLPLVYGLLDQNLLGTDEIDNAFSRRLIRSFDEIPFRDPGDGYRIFPSKAKTKKWKFLVTIGTAAEYPGSKTIVSLGLSDTGFGVYFRFIRADGCWTLVGIDDRST
jgi:hypothetical protein